MPDVQETKEDLHHKIKVLERALVKDNKKDLVRRNNNLYARLSAAKEERDKLIDERNRKRLEEAIFHFTREGCHVLGGPLRWQPAKMSIKEALEVWEYLEKYPTAMKRIAELPWIPRLTAIIEIARTLIKQKMDRLKKLGY